MKNYPLVLFAQALGQHTSLSGFLTCFFVLFVCEGRFCFVEKLSYRSTQTIKININLQENALWFDSNLKV